MIKFLRFDPILSLTDINGQQEYATDYSMFNKTHEVDMPTCRYLVEMSHLQSERVIL